VALLSPKSVAIAAISKSSATASRNQCEQLHEDHEVLRLSQNEFAPCFLPDTAALIQKRDGLCHELIKSTWHRAANKHLDTSKRHGTLKCSEQEMPSLASEHHL
jgi:hypothetical protein